MNRQEKIDYIEAHVGTLSSMCWNELDDDDLMKLWGFILGVMSRYKVSD